MLDNIRWLFVRGGISPPRTNNHLMLSNIPNYANKSSPYKHVATTS